MFVKVIVLEGSVGNEVNVAVEENDRVNEFTAEIVTLTLALTLKLVDPLRVPAGEFDRVGVACDVSDVVNVGCEILARALAECNGVIVRVGVENTVVDVLELRSALKVFDSLGECEEDDDSLFVLDSCGDIDDDAISDIVTCERAEFEEDAKFVTVKNSLAEADVESVIVVETTVLAETEDEGVIVFETI